MDCNVLSNFLYLYYDIYYFKKIKFMFSLFSLLTRGLCIVSTKLPGLFKAIVKDNRDPSGLMRLKIAVPEIYPHDGPWAAPCLVSEQPIIPEVGDEIWIAFEQGDPSFPVWLGKTIGQQVEIRNRR